MGEPDGKHRKVDSHLSCHRFSVLCNRQGILIPFAGSYLRHDIIALAGRNSNSNLVVTRAGRRTSAGMRRIGGLVPF
jgi:hypothetical protein